MSFEFRIKFYQNILNFKFNFIKIGRLDHIAKIGEKIILLEFNFIKIGRLGGNIK